MFCIQQDSEVQSLADVAEEVGNVIIPVRSCTDSVQIIQNSFAPEYTERPDCGA